MTIACGLRATLLTVVGCVTAAALTGSADAGLIVIDDFTDTNAAWPIEVFSGQTSDGNTESALTGVLGGNRSTTLANGTFGSTLDRAAVTIAPSVQGGVLDYNSTLFAASDLTLVYGNQAPPFDFTGQAGIVIDFVGFDFPADGPLELSALLTSNGESQTVTTMVSDIGSGEVFLAFADLTPLRGAFDLSDVDVVAIQFSAAAGSDFRVGSIMTRVPTPGVLAVVALTPMLAGGRRRRR